MDPIDQTVQDSASRGSWAALAALLIWLIVAIVKRDDVPIPLPPRYRPLAAFGLGQVYAVLEMVVHGMPWQSAIVRGVVVSGSVVGLHEFVGKLRPASVPPLPILFVFLVGCAPLQEAAKSPGAARIPGAVCDVVEGFTDNTFVKFFCSVVAGGALANQSTGPAGVDARPEKPATIEVLVPKDQAEAFGRANGAPHGSQ